MQQSEAKFCAATAIGSSNLTMQQIRRAAAVADVAVTVELRDGDGIDAPRTLSAMSRSMPTEWAASPRLQRRADECTADFFHYPLGQRPHSPAGEEAGGPWSPAHSSKIGHWRDRARTGRKKAPRADTLLAPSVDGVRIRRVG